MWSLLIVQCLPELKNYIIDILLLDQLSRMIGHAVAVMYRVKAHAVRGMSASDSMGCTYVRTYISGCFEILCEEPVKHRIGHNKYDLNRTRQYRFITAGSPSFPPYLKPFPEAREVACP